MLMADTVGFVRRLPHRLVEAFQSTLEEVRDADLILHLVNAAESDPEGQIEAVREVLGEIGADSVPTIIVVNKIDEASPAAIQRLLGTAETTVAVSALTGEGTEKLMETLTQWLNARSSTISVRVPYARGDALAALHRKGEVLSSKEGPDGMDLVVRLPPDQVSRFSDFINDESGGRTDPPDM